MPMMKPKILKATAVSSRKTSHPAGLRDAQRHETTRGEDCDARMTDLCGGGADEADGDLVPDTGADRYS